MKKKIIAIIIVIALILLVGFIINELTKPKIIGKQYFKPEPTSWVEKTEANKSDVEINMFKATEGHGLFVDNMQEDLRVNGKLISFFYRGGYKGVPFNTVYLADEFYNESDGKTIQEQERIAKKYALMRISNEMNPKDNTIDGFIIGKVENGTYVFYIFVDEDWKQRLEYTNILWGNDFTDSSTLHIKRFDFSNSVNGVYVNKLDSDVDWFKQNPVSGGIAVGEIDFDVLKKIINQEETNSTFMYIR
jgi:hypothetical protein